MRTAKKNKRTQSAKPKPPSEKAKPTARCARKSLMGIWRGQFSVPDEILMADTSHLWECVTNPDRVLDPERDAD